MKQLWIPPFPISGLPEEANFRKRLSPRNGSVYYSIFMTRVNQLQHTHTYKKKRIYLGIPAWNHGAALSSPSSDLLFRLSVLSGNGGGVELCVLPSVGGSGHDPELDELICEIRFALNSSLAGEFCDSLSTTENNNVACQKTWKVKRPQRKKKERERQNQLGFVYIYFYLL